MPTVRIFRDPPITRSEWRALIERDDDFVTDGIDSARWSRPGEEFALLAWREGGIESRDPSAALREKMEAIASEFDAEVSDDEEVRKLAQGRPKRPRRVHLDPLEWQIVSYLIAGAVLILAAVLLLIIRHLVG